MEGVVKCMNCGAEMGEPVRADRPYDALPGTLLCGVDVRVCSSCGEEEVSIPALAELNRVLARFIASQPGRLTGPELRFLRKVAGWSGRATAKIVGVEPETVSRWENGQAVAGPSAERLLRVVATGRLEPIKDYDAFERWLERLDTSTMTAREPTVARRDDSGGWKAELATA